MNRWTKLTQFNSCPSDPHNPTSTPIYQTATFEQESALAVGAYDYSRSGNPTRTVLQEHLASLEYGKFGFAFSSGMAAISSVLRILRSGDTIVVGRDTYGGTYRLLHKVLDRYRIRVVHVDTRDLKAVEAVLVKGGVKGVFLESPTNPLMEVTDIRAIACLAHRHGAWLAVDNSMLSPWLQNPLLLGADIVVHSGTKHLSGHSDLSAGIVITNSQEIADEVGFLQNAEGNALSPFESWLLLRGVKTLGLRIERQQSTAEALATQLSAHSCVTKVYYAGLPDHSDYFVQSQQSRGSGSVLSFTTGSVEVSKTIVEATELFTNCVSFGSLSSFISLPAAMSHSSLPKEGGRLPADLVRVSTGIEDSRDLMNDLNKAFNFAVQEHKAVA